MRWAPLGTGASVLEHLLLLDVDTDLTFSDEPPFFWGWMGVPVDVPAPLVELAHAVKKSPKAVVAEPESSRRAVTERGNIGPA